MASTKLKGDLAELKVAAHLLQLGYRIAIPYGEDWDYDLILIRGDAFERVQVKHATSDRRGNRRPVRISLADQRQGQEDQALHACVD